MKSAIDGCNQTIEMIDSDKSFTDEIRAQIKFQISNRKSSKACF